MHMQLYIDSIIGNELLIIKIIINATKSYRLTFWNNLFVSLEVVFIIKIQK